MTDTKHIEKWVNQVARGDQQAMRHLYDAFQRAMLTTAFRITNNRPDAEDAVQEAFVESFQKIGQLRQTRRYGGWLKRIVINKCLDKQRKHLRWEAPRQILPDTTDEETWYVGIPLEEIRQAIQQLPDGSREVLVLYLFEDYKHREIAEQLGISISTSKSQYQYALRRLRTQLQKWKHDAI